LTNKRTSLEVHNVACGLLVRDLRMKKKYSQDALAQVAQFDRTYIYLLESGNRSPKLDSLFKICEALEISFPKFASLLVEKIPEAQEKIKGKTFQAD